MFKYLKNANNNTYSLNTFSLISPLVLSNSEYYLKKKIYLSERCTQNKKVQFVEITKDDVIEQISNLNQLTFEVTDSCNLNCTYCAYGQFYNDYDIRSNKMLSIDKAILIINFLVEFWNSNANKSLRKNVYISFYGGEPLLNMKFIKAIIGYMKKIECPSRSFTFSMTTNAILLNNHLDYLVQNDFNLLISLDGDINNNDYRLNINGKSEFNRISKNIEKIKEKYPEYFKEKVNFNAVLHNKNSIEQIYLFFKNKYEKIPSINELSFAGIKPEMRELFLKTYNSYHDSLNDSNKKNEMVQDMFIKSATYQSATTFLHQHSGFVYKDYNDLFYSDEIVKRTNTGTCLPFSKRLFVTVAGKILPCERIGQQFVMGTIDTKVNLDFKEIANGFNYYLNKVKKQCCSCLNIKTCTQCVFQLDDLENNPICNGFMNEENFAKYAGEQIEFLEKIPEAYSRIMNEVIIS